MGVIVDKAGRAATVDGFSGGLVLIDTVHNKIHAGIFYSAVASVTNLGNNDFFELLVDVPAGTFPHLRFQILVSADAEFTLYENTETVPASPEDEIVAVNRNRVSSNTAATRFYRNPNLSSPLGDVIFGPATIPGGRGGSAAGGADSTFLEWILAPNTKYLLRVQNLGGANQDHTIIADFYENGG